MNIPHRVIDLSRAPGERQAWGKPAWVVYLWALAELVFVTNPWQISSKLRIKILRMFGANIGNDVIFRPRTRVKFPWNLSVGDRCWIGEGVWFHNQAQVNIGHDVVISQEAFLTTGSHQVRKDMALITSPINIEPGAWITSRCILLGGCRIGATAVVTPNSVVKPGQSVPAGVIFGAAEASVLGVRFSDDIQPEVSP